MAWLALFVALGGGGEVSLWCRWQGGSASASGQVLILRLDGFS